MRKRYRFGRFEICPESRQLLDRGVGTPVGGRAFDLLLALVERQGRTISRDELHEVVWPDVIVEPNNLHVQIWTLRGLLGRDAITTVARRGYRFTPEVQVITSVENSGDEVASNTRVSILPRRHHGDVVEQDGMIRNLLAQTRGQRLVTLVGDDDRSVMQATDAAVGAIRPLYESGVWFLDPLTIAGAWPNHERTVPIETASDFLPASLSRLLERLAMREALIVIQGCHRALDPVRATVSAVLARAPTIRILACSRAPLGLQGEHVVRVPLAIP